MNTVQGGSRDGASRQEELFARVGDALKVYEGRNLLERYALYMMRVQICELSLKQDLQSVFGVSEDRAETMNLSAVFRHYVSTTSGSSGSLRERSRDRATADSMAHDFLGGGQPLADLSDDFVALPVRDLEKWAWELEVAFQQYLMLKESGQLYRDWGIKPEWRPAYNQTPPLVTPEA